MSSSKKPKVNISKYHMTGHFGICQAPVDYVKEIRIKEKTAWRGRVSANSTQLVNKEDLFGGILKEGGVQGSIDFLLGGDNQLAPARLASKYQRPQDQSPGYRGLLSLLFHGLGSNPGFYWSASQPHIGAIEVDVGSFPRTLAPSQPALARVPRSGLTESASVFFVLDDSGSMAGSRLVSMKAAVNTVLDQLTFDHRLDIGGGTFNSRSISHRFAGPAELLSFRAWVDSLPASGGTNFLTGMQFAINWFNGTAHDASLGRRLLFFITDGEPSPAGSDDAAAAAAWQLISREIPVDIFTINIELQNTTAIAKLDNTPEDGLPVVSGTDPSEMSETLFFALASAFDANPAHIIYECHINEDWGLGWNPSEIDTESFEQVAQTLFDERFGLSLTWTRSSDLETFVNDILECIKGAVFTHPRTGKQTIRLMRDDFDPEALREVNPDNASLQNFSRKAWGETVNEMKVSWTNPVTNQEETVYSQDLGGIAMQGAVISDSRSFLGVRRADLAQQLSNRELRQSSALLCACEAVVDRSFWDTVPYDCVSLTWPEYGLQNLTMRVIDVNYGSSEDSKIRLSLVEDIFSLMDVEFVAPAHGEWVDPVGPPQPITGGRVLPLPAYMAVQGGYVLEDLAYPDTLAGLAVIAPPGSTEPEYTFSIEEPTPVGGTEWVQVGEPRVFFGTATLEDALAPSEFSWVGVKLVSGKVPAANDFLLIGPDDAPAEELEVALVTEVDPETGALLLMRGVLDTVPLLWPAGTPVWVGARTEYEPLPETLVAGQMASVRIDDPGGSGYLEVSSTIAARPTLPLRPANVEVNGVLFPAVVAAAGELSFTWAHRNRFMEDSTVLPWTAASTVPEDGVEYRLEVDALDPDGGVLEANWYSADLGLVTEHTVDVTELLEEKDAPPGSAYLALRVVAVRDGDVSWQNYSLRATLLQAPTGLTAEWTDDPGPDPGPPIPTDIGEPVGVGFYIGNVVVDDGGEDDGEYAIIMGGG